MNLPLYTIGFWELAWALVLVFGLPAAVVLRRSTRIPLYCLPMLVSVVFGLVGYGLFLSAVWWSPSTFVIAMLCATAALAFWEIRHGKGFGDCRDVDVAYPIGLTMLATLLYPELYFSRLPPPPHAITASLLHNHIIPGMPIDAVLQFLLNESLLGNAPLDQGATSLLGAQGSWGHGDRPPLLAGETLLATCLFDGIENRLLAYQLLGSVCQASFFLAAWAMLRSIGVPVSKAATALTLFILSGFAFFHTSFLWSKLQGAGFVAAALTLMIAGPATVPVHILLALCYALAMLSHGSVIFSLVPIGGYALVTAGTWRLAALRTLAVAASILLYLPWLAFQRFVAPPGDNLPKLFLANATTLNDGRTLLESMRDAYASLTWSEILWIRLQNAWTFFWHAPAFLAPGVEGIRSASFFAILPALGVLLIPLVLRAHSVWGDEAVLPGEYDGRLPPSVKHGLLLCGWLFLCTTLLWVAVAFAPRSAIIHQGSLFNAWLPFAVALVLLTYAPPMLQCQVSLLHVLLFLAVWVAPMPGVAYRYTPVAMLTAIACVVGMLQMLLAMHRTGDPAGDRSTHAPSMWTAHPSTTRTRCDRT